MPTFARSLVLSLCLTAVAFVSDVRAHDESQPDHEGEDQLRNETLRLTLLRDQLPSEGLTPLSASTCVGGLASGYPCNNVDLMSFVPLASMGGASGASDIWGWTDALTDRNYALVGLRNGTAFVDITDPASPVYLGKLPTHTVNSTWRELKVYQDHAYIVSEAANHGMQVFDLRQLRNVTNPPQTFTETAHYNGFGNCHNMVVNEDTGFGYCVGSGTCNSGMGTGGLHMINLQNPLLPTFAGCYGGDGYVHDAQCVVYHGPDTTYQGREICFCSDTDTLTLVDVTNKAAPVQLSRTSYPGVGYTHQGWLTADQRWFLLDDELDEQNLGHNSRTRIWDMLDLDAPFISGIYDGPTPAIDHNLFIHNGYAYEANYRAGLRVLDLTGIATGVLTEAGFFDIYPTSDSANFNAAWGVYPFFDNGIVIVSGIEQGLFVLRTTFQGDFGLDAVDDRLEICDPGSDSTTVNLTPTNQYAGSVTLSAIGLPPGSNPSFSVNPVSVPGASEMTISTAGLAPGLHTFTLRGTDGPRTHEQTVELNLAVALPGSVALTSPPDGATGQPRQPELSWAAGSGASSYSLQIATDPGFGSIVYSAALAGTMHQVADELVPDTLYHWRVAAVNPCGASMFSGVFDFRVESYPAILVVDDDDDAPDAAVSYTSALDSLGRTYHVWDTNGSDTEPAISSLAPYTTVLWLTGDAFGGAAGPGPAGEASLAQWLDAGGCLLIASQDYLEDRGLTAFLDDYLGVGSYVNDADQDLVKGEAPVFTNLGPYTLSFPYANHTDAVSPGPGAAVAFLGSTGNAGVLKDGGYYRTSFWAFGLETLPAPAAQQAVLGAFLDWCAALPLADGDADGVPNGSDCVPSNPAVWSAPSPVRELRLAAPGTNNLGWLAPAQPGAVSIVYDVLRSPDASSFASATCVEVGGSDTLASDAAEPAPDALSSYLVRVRNACGENLGAASNGTPHSGPVCP